MLRFSAYYVDSKSDCSSESISPVQWSIPVIKDNPDSKCNL